MEFALASNLTGNPATDAPILAQLQMDFAGGIQKNLALQLLAIGGDNVAAATATSTPAGTSSLAPNINIAATLANLAVLARLF